ncbi:VOC family protein [Leucobacter ruminantium]|uniref:VOC family protein n=1 Tax=Leucobacter ruminantium TaxID=1289170 RepID=A0A939RY10_9MICO|nr:VOC family protein [Leucobacter ruminantium]MBO1804381.1 VOC family protein [Leucobacter ruminantium]
MTAGFSLHHLGLVVEDLDRAVGFYTDVLGMSREGRTEWTTIAGAPLGIASDTVELRWAFLGLGPVRLELHEFRGLPVSPVRRRTQDPGLGHLALAVPDMSAAVAALEGAGAEFFSAPNLLTDSPGQEGDQWVYCRDPFGLTIELYQTATPAERARAMAAQTERND